MFSSNIFLTDFYAYFDGFMIAYTVSLQILYTLLMITGWRMVSKYVKLRGVRDYDYVADSPLSLPVTVIVPAYNEAQSVAQSVRSLLTRQMVEIEVVVVNDGSTDDTLEVLIREFDLVRAAKVPRAGIPCAKILGVWVARDNDHLVVIDKANGRKADALNAGINYASFPLVCSVDADTLLDQGALAHLVWEFQSHPDTVATGGIVRIANGSVTQDGRIDPTRTTNNLLVNTQVVEYLRAFLGGRLGWSQWKSLLIISGAFGLFNRKALIDAGGYDPTCVGEDAELVLRLYRSRADAGKPCRITFLPDPICWTEAPSTLKTLTRQRDRWQRGLAQTLWAHKSMVFRRKYGRPGMVGLPLFWLYEFILVPLGLILGFVTWQVFLLLLVLSTMYGFFLSLFIILLEERAFRGCPRWTDVGRMVLAFTIENFGYRQYMAFVRVRAMCRRPSKRHSWGDMQRQGFNTEDTEETDLSTTIGASQ